MNNRNEYVDVLKGVGISSIVLGHSCAFIFKNNIPMGPFVYTYHLMIFMFIIGYLFNLDKFEKDKNYKYQYIGKQIIKMLSLYFLYNLVFVLAHNSFVKLHIIDANYYHFKDIIKYIFAGIQFITNEKLLAALWFIPMMLFAKIIFIILYSKNIFNHRLINVLAIGILTGIIGTLLAINDAGFTYYIQVSIISVSFISLGIIYKMYEDKLSKLISTYSWMPSALIIFLILKQYISWIDLSANQLINPLIFFLLSFLGIYFCLSLAKTICYFNKSKKLFGILGENSFHIMAMHLLIIKLIDISYAYIKEITDYKLVASYPYAFSNKLWILYFILGTIIPVVIITPLKSFKKEYIDTFKTY
jgi:fucose 4-O-acetylase-like acetyltransferase